MTRIGLISDTHNYLDRSVFEHFKNCDEIWHAGDFGTIEIANQLLDEKNWNAVVNLDFAGLADVSTSLTVPGLTDDKHLKPAQARDRQHRLRGVYGNIDGYDVKSLYPEQLVFMCEEVKVMMRHIGGYPPRYNPETKKELLIHEPKLFISGHSHILKIMYDDKLNCLHINPGAAGKHGWQKVRTLVRFVIEGKDIRDCEVIEI